MFLFHSCVLQCLAYYLLLQNLAVQEISQVSEKLLFQLQSALTDPELEEQTVTDKYELNLFAAIQRLLLCCDSEHLFLRGTVSSMHNQCSCHFFPHIHLYLTLFAWANHSHLENQLEDTSAKFHFGLPFSVVIVNWTRYCKVKSLVLFRCLLPATTCKFYFFICHFFLYKWGQE